MHKNFYKNLKSNKGGVLWYKEWKLFGVCI